MKNGFTIIELVISIFILSIAIIGVFSAFSIVVILTSDATDRLTATYLAQEGIELIRNLRDTNWLHMDYCASTTVGGGYCPASWVNGPNSQGIDISVSCHPNACRADYKLQSVDANSDTDYLYLNDKGFYGYETTNTTQTKFQRRIFIKPIEDVDESLPPYHIINVKVEVSWDQKATILNDSNTKASTCGAYNCITAEVTLYNWYNTYIPSSDVTIISSNDSIAKVSGPFGTSPYYSGTITVPDETTRDILMSVLNKSQEDQEWIEDGLTQAPNPLTAGDYLIVNAEDGRTSATYDIEIPVPGGPPL